jgi:hypothetical protein
MARPLIDNAVAAFEAQPSVSFRLISFFVQRYAFTFQRSSTHGELHVGHAQLQPRIIHYAFGCPNGTDGHR